MCSKILLEDFRGDHVQIIREKGVEARRHASFPAALYCEERTAAYSSHHACFEYEQRVECLSIRARLLRCSGPPAAARLLRSMHDQVRAPAFGAMAVCAGLTTFSSLRSWSAYPASAPASIRTCDSHVLGLQAAQTKIRAGLDESVALRLSKQTYCNNRRHRRSKQMSATRVRRRFISDKAFRNSTFGLLGSIPALSESEVVSRRNDSVPVTKASGQSTEGTTFAAHADATLQSESSRQIHSRPDSSQVEAHREMHVKGDPQPQKYLNAQSGSVPYWLSVSNGARDW